ncbi:MAG: MiaB/RimO family radical SAM methylthiotransferase [Candidatus Aminicenantes bacterium]|nr:MiaB/RimO family radical SAM methylthiotransferase [Candidatus Aminicenantes bacterium]
MTSFSIRNFGCRVNQAEAFAWADDFQARGLRPAGASSPGDIVVVNTCTLTARADRDALKFIRRMARENPAARIVVTGCLAERSAAELTCLPGVWKIVPNADKDRLADAALAGRPDTQPADPPARLRARAFLKIQDGCDRACAFCIIPSVRGGSRSVAPGRVLESVSRVADRGYREVVLSGIHLSSYGRDLEPRTSLADLLTVLQAGGGGPWIRMSSFDPRLMSPELIAVLAAGPWVRPHFHLSLQHGANAVLKAMGRSPAAEENETLLNQLAAAVPEAALGADILVGFPGETAEDFRRTAELIERSPLAYVHVFAFSPRPGTAAAARPQVDGSVRKQRAVRLRALSAEKNLAFRARFLGRVLDGIAIRPTEAGAEVLTGNAIDVEASGPRPAKGEAVRVRIVAVDESGTRGEILP